MTNHVVLVSFSSRKDGNCSEITAFIESQLLNSVKTYRFDSFFIHPCGACEYECFLNGAACPYYDDKEVEILEAISESKEAIFIIPNYCDHPCANFYIFNERSNCWFQGHPDRLEQYLKIRKKFITVSGTRSESFRRAYEQHAEGTPQILYLSAKEYGSERSIDGDILKSDLVRTVVREFLLKQPEGA